MTETESTIRTSPEHDPSPHPDDLEVTVKQIEGGVAVVRVAGEIDMRTAPQLRGHVTAATASAKGLVIDLENVEFLASAGLSILVELARNAPATGLRWGIVSTGRAVLRPLEAVGLLSLVPVYASVTDALAAVDQR
jgi:anti-sigma B factor antagonist